MPDNREYETDVATDVLQKMEKELERCGVASVLVKDGELFYFSETGLRYLLAAAEGNESKRVCVLVKRQNAPAPMTGVASA